MDKRCERKGGISGDSELLVCATRRTALLSDMRAVPERGQQAGEEWSCGQAGSKMPRRHLSGEAGQWLDKQV